MEKLVWRSKKPITGVNQFVQIGMKNWRKSTASFFIALEGYKKNNTIAILAAKNGP